MSKSTGGESVNLRGLTRAQQSKTEQSKQSDAPQLQRFLATRFYPPRREGEYVARSCVSNIVDDAKNHRLTLVRAPAGYGKTTTISACYWELSKSDTLCAWLNLTDFDGSVAEFSGYLSQALSWSSDAQEKPNRQWGNGWQEVASVQSLSLELCNVASEYQKPTFLFLDDFDDIIGTDAESLIYQLLRDAPSNLHLIIASRSAPSFGIGRMRMQGQLLEAGVEQLRFSEVAATQLLGSLNAVKVDSELVSLAVEKTEGWPAGLQLVAISLNHSKNVQALLNSFNGEVQEVGEFLAEDVLEQLDPTLTEFLIKTSILKRFCVPLCNAITGRNDSREIINELERRSLFIFSLDGQGDWYRYQSLFSDFLKRVLEQRYPTEPALLKIKASEWCVGENLVVQGSQYAIDAEDFERAGNILDTHAETIMRRGLVETLYRLSARLPEKVLLEHPNLRLYEAINLILKRKFREAQHILKQSDEYVSSLEFADTDAVSLRSSLLRGKLMLAQFMDDMPALERLCQEMLSEPNKYDEALTGVLQTSLAHAQREQYRLSDVDRRSALAHDSFARSNQPMMLIGLDSVLGPSYAQRGELIAAQSCYQRALKMCEDNDNDSEIFRSGLSALLADVLLEQIEVDDARDLFSSVSHAINGMGFVEGLIASFVGRARLAAFDGQNDVADGLLQEGIDYATRQSLQRLRWCCVDERIRLHLRLKDVWNALRVSSDAGVPETDQDLYPVGEFTTKKEFMATAWARTALADGRPKESLKLLKQWLNFVKRQRCIKSQVRLSILIAQVYQSMGEIRSALRTLKDVMPHIQKSGMSFGLVEDGIAFRSLVAQVCEIEDLGNESQLNFALRLKQVFKSEEIAETNQVQVIEVPEQLDDLQYEPLNAKEIEVLKLVSRSMRNKEIADLLGLTEGTVKWYLQQIYDKFGVRRRFAALERARILGYL